MWFSRKNIPAPPAWPDPAPGTAWPTAPSVYDDRSRAEAFQALMGQARFPLARPGYDTARVDALMGVLASATALPIVDDNARKALVGAVQHVQFTMARGDGYQAGAVDDFLDRVVALLNA